MSRRTQLKGVGADNNKRLKSQKEKKKVFKKGLNSVFNTPMETPDDSATEMMSSAYLTLLMNRRGYSTPRNEVEGFGNA